MLKKLFKRAIATPVTLERVTPAPTAFPSKESALDAFREGWEDKWETSHEVVESNGGDTEWGLWTDAQKVEANSFADTVLEDDDSDAPTQPMPLRAY